MKKYSIAFLLLLIVSPLYAATYYGDSAEVDVSGTTYNYLVTLSGITLEANTEYLVTINATDTEDNAMTAVTFSFTTTDTVTDQPENIQFTSHTQGQLIESPTSQTTTITYTYDGTAISSTWACPDCSATSGDGNESSGTGSFSVTLPSAGYSAVNVPNGTFDTDSIWTYDANWSIADGLATSTSGGGSGSSAILDNGPVNGQPEAYTALVTDTAKGQREYISENFILHSIEFEVASISGSPFYTCRVGSSTENIHDLAVYKKEWVNFEPEVGTNILTDGASSFSVDDGYLFWACIRTSAAGNTMSLSQSENSTPGKYVYNSVGGVWNMNYAVGTRDQRWIINKTGGGVGYGSLYQVVPGIEDYSRKKVCLDIEAGATGNLAITPVSFLGNATTQDITVATGQQCYDDLLVLSETSPLRFSGEYEGSIDNVTIQDKGDLAATTLTVTGATGSTVETLYLNYFNSGTGTDSAVYNKNPFHDDEVPIDTTIQFTVANIDTAIVESSINVNFDSVDYVCLDAELACSAYTGEYGDGFDVVLTPPADLNPGRTTYTVTVDATQLTQTSWTFVTISSPATASNVTIRNATWDN